MHSYRTPDVKVTSHGVGFTGLLALLFIGLKLGGILSWSWWWVLSPLWMPFALIAASLLLVVVVCGFAGLVAALMKRRGKGQ